MPTVQKGARRVGLEALPGVRRTAAETETSEGAGLARARGQGRAAVFDAVAGLGGMAARVGTQVFGELTERARDEADQTAILAASNKLAEWQTKALYDPQAGAFAQKGEAAFPLPEKVRADFQQQAGAIEGALSTPKQRQAFARIAAQEWQSTDLQVRRHVFGEMRVYRAGELESAIALSTDTAIRSAQDPLLVGQHLGKAVAAIKTNAPALGLGPEAVDAQVRKVQSGVHVGVIAQLLSLEQDQKAADYFAATKGQIAADRLDEVQKALEEGGLRGAAQRTTDQILAKGGTLTEQLEAAKALEPKLRDHVEQRLEHAQLLKDRAEKEAEETSMRTAYDVLDRTADVNRIPPAQWATFPGSVRASMRAYAAAKAKGVPIVTDLPTYYALMQQAADDPAVFVGQNLLNYRGKLDEPEFKQLAGLQLSIKASDGRKADKELAGFRTKSEIVDDGLTQYGIDPKAKPDTPEGKAIAQLRRMLDRRIDAAQQDGKKVSNTEIQGAVDDLLGASVAVPGSWWNIFPGGQPFFDSTKRVLDTTTQDIPTAERTAIERALRDNGRPVTEATVLDLYIEMTLRRSKR